MLRAAQSRFRIPKV